MVLEVKVSEPVKSASGRTLTFSQSPVRIGRNHLNDIHLDDPFVSEWHGIVRFDDATMAYFDLGSTNGSMIAGQRITKNVPVALSETSLISIGRIDLSFSLTGSLRPAASTGPGNLSGNTIGWGASALRKPGGESQPGIPSLSSLEARREEPRREEPRREDPRREDPRRELAETPPPVGPGSSLHALQPARAPEVSSEATLRREKILQAFAEAFVGLKNGYEQFGSEVGVRTINGMTPLHRARTSREVLEYLEKPGIDVTAAIQNLISIFADFGIHHVAMMEAVTEGIRGTLQSLDPRANGLDGSPGILSKGRYKELWKAYLERFDQVVNDDNELHAGIFGDEFARAYARVTTGDKGGGTNGKGR
jgi:predicted component of type VI protein secretion system